jgi:hypothetical protein
VAADDSDEFALNAAQYSVPGDDKFAFTLIALLLTVTANGCIIFG